MSGCDSFVGNPAVGYLDLDPEDIPFYENAGICPVGQLEYVEDKYANLDKVNPSSVILSAEMMLRHMEWTEAADLIIKGIAGAISAKTVTYDLARLMDNPTELSCSGFGDAVIGKM